MRRSAGSGIVVFIVVLACVFAGAAAAAPTRNLAATVGEGKLVEPAGLAVDRGTGNLYVADPGLGAVVRFGPSGALAPFTAIGSAELAAPALPHTAAQVAVDNSGGASAGRFYVADGPSVEAFTRTGAPSNFAKGQGETTAENRIVGVPFAQFGEVTGVAVDAAGTIFVTDETNRLLAAFAPSGEYLGALNYGEVVGLTGGKAERVYLVERNGTVYRFDLELAVNGNSQQILKTIPAHEGVAIDQATNRMLLAGTTEAAEYEAPASGEKPPAEKIRFTFGADQLRGGAIGIAVDGSTKATKGSAYVSTGNHVDRFGPAFEAPNVVTGPATAVDSTAKTATLHGTVNPEGRAVTRCEFEYGDTYEGTFEYAGTVPCAESPAAIGAGNAPVAVHADVGGLEIGNYHFRLSASNAGGYLKGADRSFAILGTPIVEGETAEPSRTEAILGGTIGPENGRTTYRFEYGLTAAYGESSATSTIPAGRSLVRVALPIVGLDPGTTYHFRLVADNGYRTTYGPDATFTTATPTGAFACPNEAVRIGPSRTLAECRAYEMVSPPDKNGGSVYLVTNNVAAPSGEAVEYSSVANFADGAAASTSSYVARRGAEGWLSEGVDVPQLNQTAILFGATPASSEDLGQTLTISTLALAPGAVEGQSNLYIRDNFTGAVRTVYTQPGQLLYFGFTINSQIQAVAPDFSHIYFNLQYPLLPGAVPPGNGLNLYDVDHGVLKLVNRVPNAAGTEDVGAGANYVGASADGQRIFFQAPVPGGEPGEIGTYMYANGDSVLISGSEAEPDQTQPAAEFRGTNATGTVIYLSGEGLTEESRPPGITLYRYEPDSGRRTAVLPVPPEEGDPGLGRVFAVSRDGSDVYFLSRGALAPGAEDLTAEEAANIYQLHEPSPGDRTIRLIGRTDAGSNEAEIKGQLSPDGRHLAVYSTSDLSGTEAAKECGGGTTYCPQVFDFTVGGEGFACVSCGATAQSSTLGIEASELKINRVQPRSVLDNGMIFFQTVNALEPTDTNGVGDVYVWDGSAAHLISSGTGGSPSIFSDASADGRDVFFRTSQQLVGTDVDSRVDLYDARIGGGFAAQNPQAAVACEGEACRGPSPGPTSLATAAASGKRAVCSAIGRSAAAATKKLAKLRRAAKRAHGKRARVLGKRVKVARHRAKKLGARAGACRRAVR